MRRSARMLLMTGGSRGRDGDSRNGERGDYNRARDNYGEARGSYDRARDGYGEARNRYEGARDAYDGYAEDRFRDRRGREHYDNGRFAPMRGEGDDWLESRDRSGGMRNEYGGQMRYMPYPYIPPVYQEQYRGYGQGNGSRAYEGDNRPMNKIGFSLEGEMDKLPPREFDRDYRMDEMAYRRGDGRRSGYGSGSGYIPFTREIAEEWAAHMQNEDGSKGPHWSMEQAKQVMTQRGIECDPLEFWVAMNMIYSDYCKAAKKAGSNTIDFYADMAKAFLDDKDAPKDKLARYYAYIVEAGR